MYNCNRTLFSNNIRRKKLEIPFLSLLIQKLFWPPLHFFLSLLCVPQHVENIQPGKERETIESAFIHVSNLNELSTEPSNAQSFFDDHQSEPHQIVHKFYSVFLWWKEFWHDVSQGIQNIPLLKG